MTSFLGKVFKSKTPSEVIPSSMPSKGGSSGRAPVAIRIVRARTRRTVFEEAHRMRVLEHSARSHDLDARAFLTGAVEPFQARDLAVLRGDQ